MGGKTAIAAGLLMGVIAGGLVVGGLLAFMPGPTPPVSTPAPTPSPTPGASPRHSRPVPDPHRARGRLARPGGVGRGLPVRGLPLRFGGAVANERGPGVRRG